MKVILSRKGFDQKHGGMPSPILPDGTLLLLPPPCETGNLFYEDLFYQGQSYFDLLCSLRPKLSTTFKHARTSINPDIQEGLYLTPPDWKPAYGQFGSSESHLSSRHVSVGDIFLFYGWFKQTKYNEAGGLTFVENAPDVHLIYSYLQIGSIITNKNYITKKYSWHANAHIENTSKAHNTIYIPTKKLSYNNRQLGYGTLHYSKKLVLTKEGCSFSKWELPSFFRNTDVTISYHNNITNGFIPGKDYFQASPIGSEFVIHGTFDLKNWVHDLIRDQGLPNHFTASDHLLTEINHINYPDQNGKIYCRKRNKLVDIGTTSCMLCKGLRSMLNDNSIACCWMDILPENENMFTVLNPAEEYHRVNWLIDKQLIPHNSELEQE